MINPLKEYFEWHDRKYFASLLSADKNRVDIEVFSFLRIISFLSLLGACVILLISFIWPDVMTRSSSFKMGIIGCFLALVYSWVSEHLLFRIYIEKNRNSGNNSAQGK